jgi:hypothetical protein
MGVRVAAEDGGHHYSAGRTCTRLANLILAPKEEAKRIATYIPRWGGLRINVASVMFRLLLLIESLRFCAGLFV